MTFNNFQDEGKVLEWKKKLDNDVETLKAKSNIQSICSVSFYLGKIQ